MSFFKFIYFFLLFSLTPISSFLSCKENRREELLQKSIPLISFSNAPSWVEAVDYDSENYEDNISSGIAHLLINKQFNMEENTCYIRTVHKIVSTIGLSDISQLSLPPYTLQQLLPTAHHLKIIREGKVIDKLLTAKKKMFHPSSGLTEVVFYIDNLRIGDIVDFSYSVQWEKDYSPFGDAIDLKSCAFYKKIAYASLVAEDKSLFWETYDFEQEPLCTVDTPYKKYSWEINDYKKETSSSSLKNPLIAVSKMSWNDIARHYVSCQYNNKTSFASEPPQNIVELVQEWKNLYPTVEEQILAAIRLVSDDVYYASIPDDEEEHELTPYAPEKTLENSYGDCKDKSALLVALLKLLDVEAYPVLVNTKRTHELKEELPNRCFNHAIVKIVYDGKSYFIDPTATLYGGSLDTYQVPDYGYGLVIKEDSEDLVPITRKFLSKKKSTCTISIEGINATLDYQGQFCHKIANKIRNDLVPGFANEESKIILAQFETLLPNADIVYTAPLQIQDDRQANIITKNFALALKNAGRKTRRGSFFNLTPLVSHLTLLTNEIDLSKDFCLERCFCEEETSRVVDIYCDKPLVVEEKKISYKDENMSYNFTLEKLSDTHIRVNFYQKFYTTNIEAAQLPQFIKRLEEFKHHLSIKIEIPD